MTALPANPLVSVLVSVYNEEQHIKRSINSILRQSYSNLELIVVNDGSTDGTLAQLQAIDDRRLRIIDKPNTGLVDSLNLGLRQCRGELVARQDGDDYSEPHRIVRQVDEFAQRPHLVLSATWSNINRNGQVEVFRPPSTNHEIRRYLQWDNPIVHSSVMYRRATVVGIGGYFPIHPCEDYNLWIRLGIVGELRIIPEALVTRNEHDNIKTRFYYRNLNMRKIYWNRIICQADAIKAFGFNGKSLFYLAVSCGKYLLS